MLPKALAVLQMSVRMVYESIFFGMNQQNKLFLNAFFILFSLAPFICAYQPKLLKLFVVCVQACNASLMLYRYLPGHSGKTTVM